MKDKSDDDSAPPPSSLLPLLSSLISQLLLSLILLFQTPSPPPPLPPLLPLLHHFHLISTLATTIPIIPFSRKRKRNELTRLSQLADSPVPRSLDGFKGLYNMSCGSFEWLSSLLEPLLECRDPVDSPLGLGVESRLGIGLFRLATGAEYGEVCRRFVVDEGTARFCVKQLCRVLCTNYRFFVGFPSQSELNSVATQFERLTGLPNCCGVMHCTRFQVRKKSFGDSGSREDCFAAQFVVDSSSRILSIAAGFRGNKDDFDVLKASTLYNDVENGVLLKSSAVLINGVSIPQYLVGDGSYPMLSWLVVPFSDPIGGSKEENFNNVVSVLCGRVRRAIASLRNWRVLSRPIEADFKSAVAYVGACSILHNMLLMKEDYTTLSHGVDEHTVSNPRIQFSGDRGSEEGGVSDIRSALVTKARTSHSMDHETHVDN